MRLPPSIRNIKNGRQSTRCSLLELPPEIRTMIYEALAQAQAKQVKTFIMQADTCYLSRSAVKAGTLARTNRQLRQESLSILYHGLDVDIYTATEEDRRQAEYWAESVVETSLLKTINKYTLYPLASCRCRIEIDLTEPEKPVRKVENPGWCGIGRCDHLRAFFATAEEEVGKLEIGEKGRRAMTVEVMKSLLQAFCTMSAKLFQGHPMAGEKEEKEDGGDQDF
jgi:hypothetical protein